VVDLEISLKTVKEHQKQVAKAAKSAEGILKMTLNVLHRLAKRGDAIAVAVGLKPIPKLSLA
jgi:hypothetical protein